MSRPLPGCLIALPALILLLTGLGVAACGSPATAIQDTPSSLTIEAVTDVMPLIEEMADTFAHSRPGVRVQVNPLIGSADLNLVANGTISIMVMTETVSRTQGIRQIEIARQPIAVIVHADNPVRALTLGKLRDIYTGRVTDWSEVGGLSMPIMVLSRDAAATTRSRMDYALIGTDNRLTPHALLLPSDEAMGLTVSRRPEAIGYVAGADNPGGTKLVSVDGESPSGLGRGHYYPLWQSVIMVTRQQSSLDVEAFLAYVQSKQGQRVISLWGCGQGAGQQ